MFHRFFNVRVLAGKLAKIHCTRFCLLTCLHFVHRSVFLINQSVPLECPIKSMSILSNSSVFALYILLCLQLVVSANTVLHVPTHTRTHTHRQIPFFLTLLSFNGSTSSYSSFPPKSAVLRRFVCLPVLNWLPNWLDRFDYSSDSPIDFDCWSKDNNADSCLARTIRIPSGRHGCSLNATLLPDTFRFLSILRPSGVCALSLVPSLRLNLSRSIS